MPKIIRMPTTEVLAKGTDRRAFTEEMFYLYRLAGSPALREAEEWIKTQDPDDVRGTASVETIRRVLHGHVPPRWRTVEAIVLAFCFFARVSPDRERYEDQNNYDRYTLMDAAKQRWNDAIDEEPGTKPSPAPPQRFVADDPWATTAPATSGNFDDEPPF